MASIFRSRTTYDAMFQLLNDDSDAERDKMTENWAKNKIEELNFVGIVGALLANVLTSTNSWPNLLDHGTPTPWIVRACWFCGLILALAAVVTAASQAIRLHRLSCRKDGPRSIRLLISMNHRRGNGQIHPQRRQVFIWQLAVLYLILAVASMVLGLLVLAWTAAVNAGGWDGQMELAVTFSAVTFLVMVVFGWEQWLLLGWEGPGKGGDADGELHI